MQDSVSDPLNLGVKLDFDASILPPFLRVLLVTDGTVTKSLEAFFWEPIAVETVQQSTQILAVPVPSIGCVVGDEVMLRRVRLCGVLSRTVFVEAESYIRCECLPENFQQALRRQNMGVGELVREHGLETYREILSVSYDESAAQVVRTYRIVMSHQPFIQITERFPVSAFS